jgi:UTP--glucose-1-phosphate uridylyltransferase
MPAKVRKAVFPVGGLGTRFLPATKSMPKEMLPVVDKPIIHYAFEEAQAAGIEQFIFVTGRNKSSISDHFDHSYELQHNLSERDKKAELALVRDWLPEAGSIAITRQREPLGLGHAVWCARNFVGNEPFAVILADDMVLSRQPCIGQLMEQYKKTPGNIAAVMDVLREQTGNYGILDVAHTDGKLVTARGLVEKPAPKDAPSTLSIIGRYVLDPGIFDVLEKQKKGSGGEIQLTDAMNSMIGRKPFYGYRYDGIRYDCGNKIGYIEATIAFALERPDMKNAIRALLKKYGNA